VLFLFGTVFVMESAPVAQRRTFHILEEGELREIDMISGEIVRTESWNPESSTRRTWQFSQAMADLVCSKVLAGKALTKVCEEPGIPGYHIVSHWRRNNPDFSEQLDQAMSDRAEVYHDMIMEVVHELDMAAEKDLVQASRAKIEALKWMAEVGNKSRFGKKETVGGNVNVQLVVNTGIERDVIVEVGDTDDGSQG
jgi:hypothetical protein